MALAAAAGTVLFACLLAGPFRFDRKAFRRYLPAEALQAAGPLVFVSSDRSWASSNLYLYTSNLVSLPPPAGVEWLVLSGNLGSEGLEPTGLMDAQGDVSRTDDTPVRAFPEGTVWAVRDPSTAAELSRRLPGVPVQVLHFPESPVLVSPAWRASGTILARFAFLLFACCLFLSAWERRGVGFHYGYPLFLSTFSATACLAGWMGLAPIPTAAAVLAAAALAAHFLIIRQPPQARRVRLPIVAVVLLLVLGCFTLARLDFDGDMLTHWLPKARAIHYAGANDEALLQRWYGGGHRVAYPPGIPLLIAAALWTGDVGRETIGFGPALHAAVAFYRTTVALLQVSALTGALALAALIPLRRRRWGAWLVIFAIAALLAGRPAAGEVIVVPLAASAMMMMRERSQVARAAGAFLAAGLFLMKAEAILIVPLVLVPWYLAHGRPRLSEAAVFFAGVVPAAIFRWRLHELGVDTTFDFGGIGVQQFLHGLPNVPVIVSSVLSSLARSPMGAALILAVVAFTVSLRKRRWRNAVVPASALVLPAAIAALYVFSRHDPQWHVATSYLRVTATAGVAIGLHLLDLAARQSES